jgi:hypothetical protein
LEGPHELTAWLCEGVETDNRLVTANVEVKIGYFEVELTQDSKHETMCICVGAFRPDGEEEWVLYADDGSRCHPGGGAIVDHQGKLKVGDRVGVLVDLEEKEGRQGGSIQFFVNGAKFGSGFESGVTGPLVLGVEMEFIGQKVTLLPDAQRPAGF